MSATWAPPRPTYYLRVFLICLVLVVLCLAGFLFGVRMEAVTPATGIIKARDQQELRAPLTGLVELGWYEGEIGPTAGGPLRVRLDGQGNGITDPAAGTPLLVQGFQLADHRKIDRKALRFHRLEAGDEVWSGQVLAQFTAEDLLSRQAQVYVPATGEPWLVLQVPAAQGQKLNAGDPLATLAPLNGKTHQPRQLLAFLDIDEKHCGDVAPGQVVRLFSTMYNHRLHGITTAKIERIEPWGKPGEGGSRRFRAVAVVDEDHEVSLPLGSTFKAEIVVGRKVMYRIILEH